MTREELTLKTIAAYNGNLYNGMTKALEAVVEMVLEEAAKVALDEKRHGTMSVSESLVRFSVSDAIRALKG